MTSLNLLTENTLDELYVSTLHVDSVVANENATISIDAPADFTVIPEVQGTSLPQYIRNQITTTGALTYNASLGRIQGIVLDNYNRDITLSLTGDYILSANLSAGTSQSLILYFNYSDGNKLGIQPNTDPLVIRTINLASFETQLVDTFSITKAELNQDYIWAGVVDMNMFVSSSHINDTALYCEAVYYDGSTEHVLATTDTLDITSLYPAVSQIDPSAVITSSQQMAMGSEYRIKIYAVNLKNAPRTVYVYYQDGYYSHTHTTFNLASFLTNYYTKTETDTLLNTKQNGLTFNSPLVYTAGTGELGFNGSLTSKWFQVGNDIANINATGNVEVQNTMDVLGKLTVWNGIHAEFGSNVGIHTPPPTSGDVLDVNGASLFRDSLKISSGGLHITGGTSMNGSLYVRDSVAIGLTGTVNRLHVQSSNAPTAFAIGTTNNSFTQIGVAFANNQFSDGARAGDTTIRTTGGTALHIQNGITVSALTVSGNLVGIGTKNPTSQLTVSGNVDISGAVSISGLLTITGGLVLTGSATLNGNVKVNGDVAVNKLFVGNSSLSTNTNDLFINAGTTSQDIWVRPNGDGSAVGQSRFNPTLTSLQGGAITINSSNNVGIGITNPQAPLAFASSTGRKINLFSDTYAIGVESSELRYASNNFHAWRTGGYAGTELMRLDNAGDLGLGTNNPTFKLDVVGDVNVPTGSMYKINGSNLTTSNIAEGSNLYYLDSRARQSISASSPLSYDNTTGIMSISTAGASKWTDDGTRLTTTNPRRVRVGSSGTNTAIIELTTNTNTHFIFNSKETGTDGCLIARVANQAPILLADQATTNAQIGIGLGTGVVPDTNCIIHGKKTTGGIKVKVETGGASDAELILKNATGEYAWYSHNSVNSMRLYNYGTSTDLMTVLSAGNVGIGTTTPATGLENFRNTSPSASTSISARDSTNWGMLWSHCALITNNTNTTGIRFGNATNQSASGFVEQMRIAQNGNVGIGIDTPSAKLTVAGTAHITSGLVITGNATFNNNIFVSGNVGIGISANAPLDVVSNQTNGVGAVIQTNYSSPSQFALNRIVIGATGAINRIQSENQTFGGGPWNTQALALNPAGGNIGIGMNNPSQRVSIRGNTTATNKELSIGANYAVSTANERIGAVSFYTNTNTYEMARIECCNNVGSADNNADLRFFTRLDYATYPEAMRIDRVQNVGIGTTAPQARLHVKGRQRIESLNAGDSSAVIEFKPNTAGLGYFYLNNVGNFVATSSITASFIITGLSPIGGFTTVYHNIDNALSVFGSDRRIKKDIEFMTEELTDELFGSLAPVEYFMIEDASNPRDFYDPTKPRKMYGFIANDVHPKLQTTLKGILKPKCDHCSNIASHPAECQCELPECCCNGESGDIQNYIDRDILAVVASKVKVEERKTKKLQQDYDALYETMIKERVQYKVMEDKQNTRIKKLETETQTLKYQMSQLIAQLSLKGINIKF